MPADDQTDDVADGRAVEEGDGDGDRALPADVVDEAERLTRLAREAVDDAADAYRRERADLLAEHGYDARVRESDDTLVLHPAEWLDDGTVQVDRVDDVSRGVEVSLSGPGESDDWAAIESHNRDLAETVAAAEGEPHASTAHALADFAGNHYAKPIEELTGEELREFEDDYLRRNAWPSDEQLARVGETVALVFEAADAHVPRAAAERDG